MKLKNSAMSISVTSSSFTQDNPVSSVFFNEFPDHIILCSEFVSSFSSTQGKPLILKKKKKKKKETVLISKDWYTKYGDNIT